MKTIETIRSARSVLLTWCPTRATVAVRLGAILIALHCSAMTATGGEDKAKDFPGLGKPRILYNAHKDFVADKDWTHGSFYSLAFTQDGRVLVGSIHLKSQTKLFLTRRAGEVRFFDLVADDGGSKIITNASNEWIEILTTPSGVCREPLLLARSQYIRPEEVVVFQAGNNKEESLVQRFPIPRADKVTIHTANSICLALTSTPETIVLGTHRMDWEHGEPSPIYWGDVKAWDLHTGTTRFEDAWQGNIVLDIACSEDGKLVAAGGGHSAPTLLSPNRYDGRVVCWDQSFEKKQFDLALPKHQVVRLAFAPDAKTLVTGGLDGTVKWIDVTAGKVVKSLDVASHSGKTLGSVQTLAFSPDGNLLAVGVGCWNRGNKWGETFLIDVPKAEVYKVPSSQEDHVIMCVAFSPDGKYLAAGGMEGVLKLWDTKGISPISESTNDE